MHGACAVLLKDSLCNQCVCAYFLPFPFFLKKQLLIYYKILILSSRVPVVGQMHLETHSGIFRSRVQFSGAV